MNNVFTKRFPIFRKFDSTSNAGGIKRSLAVCGPNLYTSGIATGWSSPFFENGKKSAIAIFFYLISYSPLIEGWLATKEIASQFQRGRDGVFITTIINQTQPHLLTNRFICDIIEAEFKRR